MAEEQTAEGRMERAARIVLFLGCLAIIAIATGVVLGLVAAVRAFL
jgi:hypothetical protein